MKTLIGTLCDFGFGSLPLYWATEGTHSLTLVQKKEIPEDLAIIHNT